MFNQTQNIKFKGTIISPEEFKEQAFVEVTFDKVDATSLRIEVSIIADQKRRWEVSRGIKPVFLAQWLVMRPGKTVM